jgi:hypothetical protein
MVTVQLPLYNERFVVERLLSSVGELDYPRDRWQIQVLDDSDDETCALVDAAAEKLRAQGLAVDVVRRADRVGYKAGALQHGLASARGELIAIFDADFVPSPGFLRRTVPRLTADSEVGLVQARWGYLNADENALTRTQAWLLDAHFRIEHAARWRRGCAFNFNGTAGIWRRSCIEAAGGWQGDTLTEDLDLSYRAQCRGWRFVYQDEEVVASELPARWEDFRVQQFRWAKGASQCARKLLPRLWAPDSTLSLRARMEGSLHLVAQAGYVVFIGLLLASGLGVLLAAGEGAADWQERGSWLGGVATFAVVTALLFFAAPSALADGRSIGWRDRLAFLLTVPAAIGLALSNARAVFEGWMGADSAFERTPKHGGSTMGRRYRAVVVKGWSLAELALGGLFVGLTLKAVLLAAWGEAILTLLPAVGFIWAGGASVLAGGWRHSASVRPGGEVARDRAAKAVDVSLTSP